MPTSIFTIIDTVYNLHVGTQNMGCHLGQTVRAFTILGSLAVSLSNLQVGLSNLQVGMSNL